MSQIDITLYHGSIFMLGIQKYETPVKYLNGVWGHILLMDEVMIRTDEEWHCFHGKGTEILGKVTFYY